MEKYGRIPFIYTSFETPYSFIHVEKKQSVISVIDSWRPCDAHMGMDKWVNIGSGNPQKKI